ncbi:MAG: hypothetical protein AAF688_13945 [Bacteroidota bacterium]
MILNKFKHTINRKINYMVNRQLSALQTSFSYAQLSNLFDKAVFLPMTSWSLSPNLILHVLNDIEINSRQCIVEFGSGASTIYIAQLLKISNSKSKFYSIESDEIWASKILKQLVRLDLQDYVDITLAPKRKVPIDLAYKNQEIWYDVKAIDKKFTGLEKIDLMLIDGPSGDNTPFARFSAIPFFKNKLANSFCIFLDDTNRFYEAQIVSLWQKELNCNLRTLTGYTLLTANTSFGFTPYSL